MLAITAMMLGGKLLKVGGKLAISRACCCVTCTCAKMPEILRVTWTLTDTCCAGTPSGLTRDVELNKIGGGDDCCSWEYSIGSGDAIDCPENTGDPTSGPGIAFKIKYCKATGILSVIPFGLAYCQPTEARNIATISCEDGKVAAGISGIPMGNGCTTPCSLTMSLDIAGG